MGSALPSHEAKVRAEGRSECLGDMFLLGGLEETSCRGRLRGCLSLLSSVGPCGQANVPSPSWQVTDLQQELAEARRALTELESEREQKQRDFDRKLLLAKSRIETEEVSPSGRAAGTPSCPALADPPSPSVLQAEKERLAMEVRDLQQRMRFLQEQLAPVTRQREYQEKEIQRLNKVGARENPPPCKMSFTFSSLFSSLRPKN